jgi:hypothetical protein
MQKKPSDDRYGVKQSSYRGDIGMAEYQVTKVHKLTRKMFRTWVMQRRASLPTVEGHDVFLDRERADNYERAIDRQARAKLISCLANDMLPVVAAAETYHQALEAVRPDHLGYAMSKRGQFMTDVIALRQRHKQSVKDYVAEGRQCLVCIRQAGAEQPATLLIPCFKAGIDARMRPSVLPLLTQ